MDGHVMAAMTGFASGSSCAIKESYTYLLLLSFDWKPRWPFLTYWLEVANRSASINQTAYDGSQWEHCQWSCGFVKLKHFFNPQSTL